MFDNRIYPKSVSTLPKNFVVWLYVQCVHLNKSKSRFFWRSREHGAWSREWHPNFLERFFSERNITTFGFSIHLSFFSMISLLTLWRVCDHWWRIVRNTREKSQGKKQARFFPSGFSFAFLIRTFLFPKIENSESSGYCLMPSIHLILLLKLLRGKKILNTTFEV